MSENKHSAGAWSFYTEPQPNGCPIVGARGVMIAMLAHSVNYADQKETALANARLIAAAPDLLEALKPFIDFPADVLDSFDEDDQQSFTMTVRGFNMIAAIQAVRKALGSNHE